MEKSGDKPPLAETKIRQRHDRQDSAAAQPAYRTDVLAVSKPPSLPDLAREDRIEHLAACVIETALYEAMTLRVGPSYILEALDRARLVVDRMAHLSATGQLNADRMNELREWLGMATVPTAAATEVTARDGARQRR